ncbi:right-handed parallel beta-helix repeat-containing protein [Metabacillus halosaccharovorans]|uniref:right-handed parallel beta-helix repeat-containing protein n=1 Tax=Metabacillus halosaccharovorans TaxID=930124 RepID=UPI00403E01A5
MGVNWRNEIIDGGSFKTQQTGIYTGISINKSINTIEIGENYVAMATPIPYDINYTNKVIWESSNPSVCSVNYGVLEGKTEGVATITAYDTTKTYSNSFQIQVVKPVVDTIQSDQIYNVSIGEFDIFTDNSHSFKTTLGIINALNFASKNGYKKTVFPQGAYLVSPDAGTISLPSNMVIDFSHSTINIELSSKIGIGYKMFVMDNVEYTKLINVYVYGEADSTTVANSNEDNISLHIVDCYKSGIENCAFSKSSGFNVKTGTKRFKYGTGDAWITYSNFEPGSIDNFGVNDDKNIHFHFRTPNFIDVSRLGSNYILGYNQGYWDYRYLRSRLYSIYFYDKNYQFIETQQFNLQYYNYAKPINAYFAKIVVYQEAAPTSGDTDFNGAVAFIRTLGIPRKCFIKNCTFEDNFSTGLAMTGGQDWTIEGSIFSRNTGRMPGCDIDWEDGWDAMVGDIVKNNTFNSVLGIVTAAGANISIFDNYFNNSYLYIWPRTQNWRVFRNTFDGKAAGQFDIQLGTQGDSYFAENLLKTIRYHTTKNDMNAAYQIHAINNTLQ